jgi:hypothetical protein
MEEMRIAALMKIATKRLKKMMVAGQTTTMHL